MKTKKYAAIFDWDRTGNGDFLDAKIIWYVCDGEITADKAILLDDGEVVEVVDSPGIADMVDYDELKRASIPENEIDG